MSPSGPSFVARVLHQIEILAHAFAPIRRAVRDGQLNPLEPEIQMLIDIVARAVGRDALFGFPADQLVHRHVERFAHNVPERQIHPADGVHADARPVVTHAGPPENIPIAFDVERIFPQQQLTEMLFHQRAAARPALPVALDPLIRADLDEEAPHLSRIGHEKRAHGLVFGINRHGARHFHAIGRPCIRGGRVGRQGMLRLRIHQTNRSDFEIALFVRKNQGRGCSPRRQSEKCSSIHAEGDHIAKPVGQISDLPAICIWPAGTITCLT